MERMEKAKGDELLYPRNPVTHDFSLLHFLSVLLHFCETLNTVQIFFELKVKIAFRNKGYDLVLFIK